MADRADGNFQRCQSTGVLGFGGTNCFIVNVNSAQPRGLVPEGQADT